MANFKVTRKNMAYFIIARKQHDLFQQLDLFHGCIETTSFFKGKMKQHGLIQGSNETT